MKSALVWSIALTLFSSAGFAAETDIQKLMADKIESDPAAFNESIKGSLSSKGQIKGIQELPISKIFFVDAEHGIYLITPDARFVFEGTLKDVWHRKTIKSLEDARSTERVPLSNIGFKPEEQLAAFRIGNQNIPRQGVVFVDPTSELTINFLQLLKQNENAVNWTVVLLPLVGGNNAVDRARRIWCATDRQGAVNDLINGTSSALGSLKDGCTEEPIIMGMMITDIFQIKSLPHLIREDGLTSHGVPTDFNAWLKQP